VTAISGDRLMTDIRVLYATFPTPAEAEAVAALLLERKLIACANIGGGFRSIYRWEGRPHSEPETILIAKTTAARVEAAIETLAREHSYECPCVTSWPVETGHPPYLQWVADELA
jgi:periplasmic divalent cation tolerance protein